MLAKMGWKEGSGLGLSGEGRVDPVVAMSFSNRAGLGASKGKGPPGETGGHGSYSQKTKEAVSPGILLRLS